MYKTITLEDLKNLKELSLEKRKNELLSLVEKWFATKNFILSRLSKYNIEHTYSDPTFEVWVESDDSYSSIYVCNHPQFKVGNLSILCLDKCFKVKLLNFLDYYDEPLIAPFNSDGETKFPIEDIDIVILKPTMFAYKFHKLALAVQKIESLRKDFSATYDFVFEYNEEQGLYAWEVDEEDYKDYFDKDVVDDEDKDSDVDDNDDEDDEDYDDDDE